MEQPEEKIRFKSVIICLIAGSALTLAFSPYDYATVSIISSAVLFYIWLKSAPKAAFVYGYAYGLGMFGVGVNWLHISINLFGGVNLAGALFFTYLLVAFLALYPACVGFISRKYSSNNTLWLLFMVPALWTIAEWCRAWIFTGFPWLNLGYSQMDTWISGLAAVSGIYGLTWLVCLNAALLVHLFKSTPKQKWAAVAALVLIWGFSFFMHQLDWTKPDSGEKSIAIVQAAIPQELKWQPETQQRTLELYMELSGPYWGNDLILWPETAIPMFYHQALPFLDKLTEVTIQRNTNLVTGIPYLDADSNRYYNSIINVGVENGIYHKRHLVPFGEYLPLDRWLRPVLNAMGIPMSNFKAGSDRPLMTVAGVPAGMSICYEAVFGEEMIDALPEAKFLINVSNDAWFGDSLAPHQHLQMARMRARETGRYLLRATNTGISAIIDENGKVISRSPQFEPYALAGIIKLFEGATPYSRYGNYPVILLAIIVFSICCMVSRKQHRNADQA